MQTQGRNIRHYCNYLTERARAFGKSKTDWVRDGEARLERATVEKGLLREVELVQRQLQALIKCDVRIRSKNTLKRASWLTRKKILADNEPDNEIGITAFRLLVMDLLALFQALNQGMIKVLGRITANFHRTSPFLIIIQVLSSNCQNQTQRGLWKFTETSRSILISSWPI